MARPAVRRIPPPRGVTIDSADELIAFQHAIAQRWALPRVRIALRLPLAEAHRHEHERQINRLLTTTGYREGLAAAVLLTIASLVWPLPSAGPTSLAAMATWAAQGFLAWVLGWHLGRQVGVARLRLQLRRRFAHVLRDLQAPRAR